MASERPAWLDHAPPELPIYVEGLVAAIARVMTIVGDNTVIADLLRSGIELMSLIDPDAMNEALRAAKADPVYRPDPDHDLLIVAGFMDLLGVSPSAAAARFNVLQPGERSLIVEAMADLTGDPPHNATTEGH